MDPDRDDVDDPLPAPMPLLPRAEAMLTLRRSFVDFCSEHHVEIGLLGDRDTLYFMSQWLRPGRRPIDALADDVDGDLPQ